MNIKHFLYTCKINVKMLRFTTALDWPETYVKKYIAAVKSVKGCYI